MITIDTDLFEMSGGLPFLDANFSPTPILSLVACRRRSLSKTHGSEKNNDIVRFLDPNVAHHIYDNLGISPTPLPSTEFSDKEKTLIESSIKEIIRSKNGWRNEFNLPINYRKLEVDKLSCTILGVPQHIFISPKALNHKFHLFEIIIHELSHVWLALYAEVLDLQVISNPVHILPSGTNGKDIRAVLLAAFFAAAVYEFLISTKIQRGSDFYDHKPYLKECIEILSSTKDELTPLGMSLTNRLALYAHRI